MLFCLTQTLPLFSWIHKSFKTVGALFKNRLCITNHEDKAFFTLAAIWYQNWWLVPYKMNGKKHAQSHLHLLLHFGCQKPSKSCENGAQNGWVELRTTTLRRVWPQPPSTCADVTSKRCNSSPKDTPKLPILRSCGGHLEVVLTDKWFRDLHMTQVWHSYAQAWFRSALKGQDWSTSSL